MSGILTWAWKNNETNEQKEKENDKKWKMKTKWIVDGLTKTRTTANGNENRVWGILMSAWNNNKTNEHKEKKNDK